MEAAKSSETLISYHNTTWHHKAEEVDVIRNKAQFELHVNLGFNWTSGTKKKKYCRSTVQNFMEIRPSVVSEIKVDTDGREELSNLHFIQRTH
jgi:hypothetical protein